MPYVIHKVSRMPARTSYNGSTCQQADVTGGQVYADKRSAMRDARKLSAHNPVGFTVSPQPCAEPLPFDFSAQLAERILTEPTV